MNVKPHGTLGIDEKGHWQCKNTPLFFELSQGMEWHFCKYKMTKMVLLVFRHHIGGGV